GVAPLLKTNPNYDQELSRVKIVAKAIDDPVAALKAKAAEDRHLAAQAVMTRYSRIITTPQGGEPKIEDIPAEQNKLLLDVLLELPWMPKGGLLAADVSRSALWNYVHAERYGFQPPVVPRPGRGKA